MHAFTTRRLAMLFVRSVMQIDSLQGTGDDGFQPFQLTTMYYK